MRLTNSHETHKITWDSQTRMRLTKKNQNLNSIPCNNTMLTQPNHITASVVQNPNDIKYKWHKIQLTWNTNDIHGYIVKYIWHRDPLKPSPSATRMKPAKEGLKPGIAHYRVSSQLRAHTIHKPTLIPTTFSKSSPVWTSHLQKKSITRVSILRRSS